MQAQFTLERVLILMLRLPAARQLKFADRPLRSSAGAERGAREKITASEHTVMMSNLGHKARRCFLVMKGGDLPAGRAVRYTQTSP